MSQHWHVVVQIVNAMLQAKSSVISDIESGGDGRPVDIIVPVTIVVLGSYAKILESTPAGHSAESFVMFARSTMKAKVTKLISRDNPAADSKVTFVITECTLEVQQFADKVDDCYKHMPFLAAPTAYQPFAYPHMAAPLPYSAGPLMGSYQPAYHHHSMVPAASSMAGFPASSQQLQQNTGYHQNPGHQGQPQQQSAWPICKNFSKYGDCRRPGCRFQHIPAPHHAPAGGLPIAPQQPK